MRHKFKKLMQLTWDAKKRDLGLLGWIKQKKKKNYYVIAVVSIVFKWKKIIMPCMSNLTERIISLECWIDRVESVRGR